MAAALVAAGRPSSLPARDDKTHVFHTRIRSVVQEARSTARSTVRYNLKRPDEVFPLSAALREISGLTILNDRHLGAVEDENADLYILDKRTGEEVATVDFGKKGDYEGVESVGSTVFVLRSDGNIYRFINDGDDKVDADKWETGLSRRNDTEGLAFDPATGRLLIACKEYPGDDLDGYRAIYSVRADEEEKVQAPEYTINMEEIEAALPGSRVEAWLRSFLRRALDVADFKPSAVAVHPATNRIWVLSSVFKSVAVLDRDGDIVAVHKLDPSTLRQPEGLAIDADGTVYIASEGAGGTARLAVFRPI